MNKVISKTIRIILEAAIVAFILVLTTTLSLPKATETAKQEAITLTVKILKAVDINIKRIVDKLEEVK